jgi:hypothetical protein
MTAWFALGSQQGRESELDMRDGGSRLDEVPILFIRSSKSILFFRTRIFLPPANRQISATVTVLMTLESVDGQSA